jgi:hypothetical protein
MSANSFFLGAIPAKKYVYISSLPHSPCVAHIITIGAKKLGIFKMRFLFVNL